jgi:hypothetical protein
VYGQSTYFVFFDYSWQFFSTKWHITFSITEAEVCDLWSDISVISHGLVYFSLCCNITSHCLVAVCIVVSPCHRFQQWNISWFCVSLCINIYFPAWCRFWYTLFCGYLALAVSFNGFVCIFLCALCRFHASWNGPVLSRQQSSTWFSTPGLRHHRRQHPHHHWTRWETHTSWPFTNDSGQNSSIGCQYYVISTTFWLLWCYLYQFCLFVKLFGQLT